VLLAEAAPARLAGASAPASQAPPLPQAAFGQSQASADRRRPALEAVPSCRAASEAC